MKEAKEFMGRAFDYKPSEQKEKKQTIAAKLLAMIRGSGIVLIRDQDGTPYARVVVDKHRETMALKTSGFRNWVAGLWYRQETTTIKAEHIKEALVILEYDCSQAPKTSVHLRWANLGSMIYLDLGTDTWEAVEINPKGWRIIPDPPVVFRRNGNMAAFPVPLEKGDLADLRPFFTGDDEAYTLYLGTILASITNGSYFISMVHGEQGSAKTWAIKFARRLVDPVGKVEVRSLPKSPDDDLIKTIQHTRAVAFDNVSVITNEMSDFLCSLSTGGGQQSRALYTDDDVKNYDYKRPVWINGIPDLTERPDLADRVVTIRLPVLDVKVEEEELESRWRDALPSILGGFLNTIVGGLGRLDATPKCGAFRMAGAVRWVNACLDNQDFEERYKQNREESRDSALEASPISALLISWLRASKAAGGGGGSYVGTASEVRNAVLSHAHNRSSPISRYFPEMANRFSNQLRRDAPLLREVESIDARFFRSHGLNKIELKTIEPTKPEPEDNNVVNTSQVVAATYKRGDWVEVKEVDGPLQIVDLSFYGPGAEYYSLEAIDPCQVFPKGSTVNTNFGKPRLFVGLPDIARSVQHPRSA